MFTKCEDALFLHGETDVYQNYSQQKFESRNMAKEILERFHRNYKIKDGSGRLLRDLRASGNYITGSTLSPSGVGIFLSATVLYTRGFSSQSEKVTNIYNRKKALRLPTEE
jgi:hypothetical protein